MASNLAEINKQHKQVSKCGDRKTLRFTVYRVKHKKHQTIVHEKEEPLVKQLTAGHTDVIYVNGIELRQRLKPLTPIKSETNNSLLSDKQVCRKTHAAQVNLKMWGWKDNKGPSFPRYTQKRQTTATKNNYSLINELTTYPRHIRNRNSRKSRHHHLYNKKKTVL